MKTKTKLIVGCCVLSISLGGCKHESPHKNIDYIDSYSRSLFCTYYNSANYWIYHNQNNSYDSMYINGIDSSYDSSGIYENFAIEIASTVSNQEVDMYLTRVPGSQKTYAFVNYYLPYGITYELDFSNGMIDSNGLSPYSYAETLYNYQVNQYSFPQAVKIYAVGDSTRYVIYAPNVGIVEKRLDLSTTLYKLTNYLVIN
jgi:hypothetical protein